MPLKTSMEQLIKKIELRSGPTGPGKTVEIETGHMTVFVGPNHSGKSVLLREIKEHIPRADVSLGNKVLQKVSFNPFDAEFQRQLRDELGTSATEYLEGERAMVQLRIQGGGDHTIEKKEFDEIREKVDSIENLRRQLQPWGHNRVNRLSTLLGGTERLTMLNETSRGNLRTKLASIHGVLFQNDKKRAEFQRIVNDAFGWFFVIDPTGESNFRIAVSETAPPAGIERSLSDQAIDFFQNCNGIETTSDGVRAFCGMIAAVIASEARLILIDEPEAFLHPALAMALAKELAQQATKNHLQVIAATHNAPFVMGCVQAGIDLTIVRLTFRKNLATSRVLSTADLVPLMRDPLMRSTGAINGIFYDAVIVTEADRDRAFYDEINHRNVAFNLRGGLRNCLFLNAQNWQTTARIIGPLRRLGVAAATIVDVDLILEDKGVAFQNLLEAAGMPEGSRRSLGQLRGDLRSKVAHRKGDLKSQGINALDGTERQDLENFINQLAEYGIFLVPVGEVEGWLRFLHKTPPEKSEWLSATFAAMGEDSSAHGYLKPTNEDVWLFLQQVRSWLENPDRRGIPGA
jgi:ABC-type cobalamin/Fe3+-siderophores transport system ATPase subunit